MKKVALLILLINSCFNLYGQFSKGQKQLIGTATIFIDQTESEFGVNQFAMQDENYNREITFSPKIGFFISDKVSLGAGLSYSNQFTNIKLSNSGNSFGEFEQSSSIFGVEGFARLHKSISESFIFFIQPSAGISFGNE